MTKSAEVIYYYIDKSPEIDSFGNDKKVKKWRSFMKNILVISDGGFSFSTVVESMKNIAYERKLKVDIFLGAAGALFHGVNFEHIGVVLVTPRLKKYLNNIKAVIPAHIPMQVIEGHQYGDHEGLLDLGLELMNK